MIFILMDNESKVFLKKLKTQHFKISYQLGSIDYLKPLQKGKYASLKYANSFLTSNIYITLSI